MPQQTAPNRSVALWRERERAHAVAATQRRVAMHRLVVLALVVVGTAALMVPVTVVPGADVHSWWMPVGAGLGWIAGSFIRRAVITMIFLVCSTAALAAVATAVRLVESGGLGTALRHGLQVHAELAAGIAVQAIILLAVVTGWRILRTATGRDRTPHDGGFWPT